MLTNTIGLIGNWSMDGAQGILVDGFRSPVDINAIVATRGREPSADDAAPTPSPVLMKPAGEDDWRPLPVGLPDTA